MPKAAVEIPMLSVSAVIVVPSKTKLTVLFARPAWPATSNSLALRASGLPSFEETGEVRSRVGRGPTVTSPEALLLSYCWSP